MNQSSPQSQDNSEDRPRPDAGSSRSLLAGAALQAEEGATLSLRKEVRRVIENEELSPKEKVQALLQAGLDWFGLEVGFLAEIDLTESSHRTVVAAGAHPKLQEGADADLPDTYCREIVTQSEVLTIEDAAQQGWAKDPAYQKYDLSCYLGAKIIVEGQLYGTVCFGSREPSPEPMGPGDEAVLELVAQSIEQAIEQGRQQRETDQLRGKYELLLEAAPNAIVLAEIDTGRIVEANRRAAEMIGAEEEEIAGRHQTELHPSGEAARYRRLFRECCRPGVEGTVRRFEDGSPIYIQTEEGKKVPVAISAATVEVGARQLAVGIFRDVSERRRRERELRHRSDAMEAASDGIAILSSEGTYQYVNQAHADIYGYDAPEPLLGRSWTVCYDDEERQRLEAEAMPELHEKGQWRGEALGQRADGSSFPQELSLTRLEDGSIICVVRDITAQKKREEALRAAKEEAETARRRRRRRGR
jgi:PAS domain S-box-containing protein